LCAPWQFFLFDFDAAIEHLSGTTKAQQMVVSTAVEYLDELSQTAGTDRGLLKEMAEAYSRLAKVQGTAGVSGDGRYETASVSPRHSVELYRRLAAIDPSERRTLARSLLDMAHIEENLLQKAGNLEHSREATQILDTLQMASPQDTRLSVDCAIAHLTLSQALLASGQLPEALTQSLKGEEYLRVTLGTGDPQLNKYRFAIALQDEAMVHLASGNVQKGIDILERALQIIRAITAVDPRNRYYQYLLSQHMGALAEAYYSLDEVSAGDPRKSAAVQSERLEATRQYVAVDPGDKGALSKIAIVESESALSMMEINPRRAMELAQSSMARWEQALKLTGADQFAVTRRARALIRLALALLSAGRPADAVAPSHEAVDVFSGLTSKPDGASYVKSDVLALAVWGQALTATERFDEAARAFEEAAALGERLQGEEHAPLSNTVVATFAFDHFGEYWRGRRDGVQARGWFERSRQAWAARSEQTTAVEGRRKYAEARLNSLQP
jgi:tetratricopeptide (TPR) repeat protein